MLWFIPGSGESQGRCVVQPGPHQYLFSSNSNPDSNPAASWAITGEIYKMELDGTIIGKFGKAGKGLGEFSTVHEIDCRNPDQLYVSEISAWRAQKIILTPSKMQPATSSAAAANVAHERGVAGTQATFSTCFGEPFMPRHPSVYGNLLKALIAEHSVDCWLVNTGWTGGPYRQGRRIQLAHTRPMARAALSGELDDVATVEDPVVGLAVPKSVPGVAHEPLRRRGTWANSGSIDGAGRRLRLVRRERSRAPQLGQKWAPSGTGFPQLGQAILEA